MQRTSSSSATSPGLAAVRLGWPVSNAWLLRHTPLGPVLVDSGFPLLWPTIRAGLGRAGLRPEQLAAVLLTHRHSDHAGNAARLQRRHGVTVWAHPSDAEVLQGGRRGPVLRDEHSVIGDLMARYENRHPAEGLEPEPLQPGQQLAGLEVLELPGHTAGSVALYHAESATLFSGDALLAAHPPLTARSGLCLPYAAYCEDHRQALASLQRLLRSGLEVRTLCAGHGPPLVGDILARLARLLQHPAGG